MATAPRGESPVYISDNGENRRQAEKGWHVALQASRESIEKHGIDYRIMGSGGLHLFSDNRDMFGFTPRKGNYIFLHQEDAESMAKPGIHDVWEVAIPESRRNKFFHDIGLGPNYSAQTPTRIPRTHINMLPPKQGPPNPEHVERFSSKIEAVTDHLRNLNKGQFSGGN